MKEIVSISLGPSTTDYEFTTFFLGKPMRVRRFGTDNDVKKAMQLMHEWDQHTDVISLGDVKFPYMIGNNYLFRKDTTRLQREAKKLKTPVIMGTSLRKVAYEWTLRHINFKLGNGHYFKNSRVLFISGMFSYSMAKVMSEYTDNLIFADPVLENGLPMLLHSIKELESYANGPHQLFQWIPSKQFTDSSSIFKKLNHQLIRQAVKNSHIIVIPYQNFFKHISNLYFMELGDKTVITSTAYEDRIAALKEKGVTVIIDSTPKIFQRVVAINVLEAMIIAGLEKKPNELTDDDLLEVISECRMDPRIIYPFGKVKRVNRFAFVIHPLTQHQLNKYEVFDIITRKIPPSLMNLFENLASYTPPLVYSKVTGIKSLTGVESEGWLISIGSTPRAMLMHSPLFTYRQLWQAADMAKKMGAQIMGLGAFTKVVGDAGLTVAKHSNLPITTGNSYSASAVLWAAIETVKRLGLVPVIDGERSPGKAMVIGATGSIGSVCCHLLARMFTELYMVDSRDAHLLALRETILDETPDAKLYISIRADKYLSEMDMIINSTSIGRKIPIDIMKVKPGCIITDVARPLDITLEQAQKRPDVLVIESGEIELPGTPLMKDIGLPRGVVYACLAETIVLALEGRFENFTIGREIEWQKVKEIYKLGLKHGMKLAAITGLNGILRDEDFARVKSLALAARKKTAAIQET
ncbi:MAG: dehydrogenase [Desulfobacterales bacterium]|nr:dehydrogenase [Desulfobacterales bacterium]